jgi:type II secretory pathway component PulF
MVYPVIIVSAMVIVMFIIMVFVVPKLSEVYTEIGLALPLPTRILIGTSKFMSTFWWLIIILVVGGIYALQRYRKTQEGSLVIDSLILKVPIIGKLNRDSSVTEFTRTLGLLVGAGVPILESLKIAGSTATNALHRAAVAKVAALVEKGAQLSKAIAAEEAFPPLIPQMMSVGEETGKMDEVLAKVSHFFELEVEQEVKNLTTAIEPLIMIVLGIMVALLMISIILPIYSITQAF